MTRALLPPILNNIVPVSFLLKAGTVVLLAIATSITLHGQDAEPLATVADTKFSVDRGFFDQPFVVEITSATEDAEIFYTTNGAEPGNLFTGRRYPSEGIRIETTTVLRAQAQKAGHEPTNIDTQTYIFPHHVVEQPDEPAGFSTAWQGSDYGMDRDPNHLPLIAGDDSLTPALAKKVIADALLALPSMSLVMEHKDLFGTSQGIYHHTQGRGRDWERPVSVELIHPDGSPGFQVDAGIRMQGFTSRDPARNPKHSLRLVFRREYGPPKLDYPLFGIDAASRFDTLVLRSNSQDAWVYDAASNRAGQFVRDEWARQTQLALGRPAPRGTWVHLYLNGLYWGVYNPTERPDSSFMESYFGGDKEDYDILKNHEEVIDGTGDAYAAALALIQKDPEQFSSGYLDLTDHAPYEAAARYVDVPNLIDYLIPNMFAAATDWPGNNYIGRDRTRDGEGFKFFSWDNEHGMKHAITENRVLPHRRDEDSPTKFHHAFAANEVYRLRFADQLHRAFFNGGPLYVDPKQPRWDPEDPGRNQPAARWMALTSHIEEALIAESARWGDYRRAIPYTVAKDFRELRQELLDNWFPQRSAIVLDQFRDRGLYPQLHAPVFNQHGGHVEESFRLTMQSKSVSVFLPRARILYTVDGTDPRLFGGEVNAAAMVYRESVAMAQSTMVKARVERKGKWSALNEAVFIIGAAPASGENLLISEIHYHPAPPNPAEQEKGYDSGSDFEYLELYNPSNAAVSLNGLRLAGGVRFDFAEAAADKIDAGQRLRLVNNPEAYHSRSVSDIPVEGIYMGKLSNGGETLAILDGAGKPLVEVTYDDEGAWPEEADGEGPALVLIDPQPNLDLNDPKNWSADASPGESSPWHLWLQSQTEPDPLAEFANTGLSNLAAYYLGADLLPNAPLMAITAAGPEAEMLELQFARRHRGLEGMLVQLEGSADLIDWHPLDPLEITSSMDMETHPGMERVRMRLERGIAYLRLRIIKR